MKSLELFFTVSPHKMGFCEMQLPPLLKSLSIFNERLNKKIKIQPTVVMLFCPAILTGAWVFFFFFAFSLQIPVSPWRR